MPAPSEPPVLIDRYRRHLNYLRISITDRCNLRCLYCVPSGPFAHLPHREILTMEEILRFVTVGVRPGNLQSQGHRRRTTGAQGSLQPFGPALRHRRNHRRLADHQRGSAVPVSPGIAGGRHPQDQCQPGHPRSGPVQPDHPTRSLPTGLGGDPGRSRRRLLPHKNQCSGAQRYQRR